MTDWSSIHEQGRYLPVVIDMRSGTHRLLTVESVEHSEAIRIFQSLGPNEPHYYRRVSIRIHEHKEEKTAEFKLPPSLTLVDD